MLGRTHLAAAIFLSALFFSFYSFNTLTNILVFLTLLIASIFPDIDSSRSILGRKIKIISFITKHRGFFHSIPALILFSALIYFTTTHLLGIVFAIGFCSHLILDAITKEGLSFFGIKIRGPIIVGSPIEHAFYFMLLLISLFLII